MEGSTTKRTFIATPGRSVFYTLADGVIRPALILDVDEDLRAADLLVFKKHEDVNAPEATITGVNNLEHHGCVVGHDPGTWFPPPIFTAGGDLIDYDQVAFIPAPVAEAVEEA